MTHTRRQLHDANAHAVRIWVMHPETLDWVRISLRDGERVTLGGRRHTTDEGWTLAADTYTREGLTVYRDRLRDGRDCDGRLTRGCRYRWYAAEGGRLWQAPVEDAPLQPYWESDDEWQRDEYAEAAGY